MKKLLLLSMILAFAASINAQTSDRKWGAGLGLGAYGTLNDGGLGLMPEMYLSRYLSPKLDLMLKGDLGVYRSGMSSTTDLANPLLNLRYKLGDESKKFRPYLFAGPGFLADNSTSGMNFDLGLGAKYYISQATAFYFDAGYLNGISATRAANSVHDNIWKATLGMEFDFGKAKDSDMDGVSDKKDKCPDTPAGVVVDKNGCPVDTDGDGVPDYLDKCPTVKGLVSLNGCPDADGDGVADINDKCPDTPKGWKVDATGCPLDLDKDGVADAIDKCPDTPAGVAVDKVGCPIDTDGDGVPDYLDKCPTVAGPKENNGCPVKEETAAQVEAKKLIVEPVYFDSNKSNYSATEKTKIEKLVSLLKENSNYNVSITGYADSKGKENTNLILSKNRVSSVVQAITSKGIKKARISAQKGLGIANPAASNETPEGRALNRRVEFEVIKTK